VESFLYLRLFQCTEGFSLNLTEECILLGKQYFLSDHCSYPFPIPPIEVLKACHEKSSGDDCVANKCIDEATKLSIDGKISVEHVSDVFKTTLIKMELSESEWMPAINKSIESCKGISELEKLRLNEVDRSFL
jgi:hypothetical protein